MKNIFILLSIAIILFYIVSTIFIYVHQRTLLYHKKENTPHKGTDIFLNNDNEKIQIIKLDGNNGRAILYFGGNGETISNSVDYIRKQFPNHTVYLMNYRGYGLSSGEPSEKALFSDALALFDYVHKDYSDISVGGRSLGSGVASYLASKRDVSKLVLITPFNSIVDIAKKLYPIFPVSLLLKDQYRSEDYVKDIKAETLLMIAENDTLVLRKFSDKLINKFKELNKNYKVITIKGRNHGDISSDDKYFKDVQDFVN